MLYDVIINKFYYGEEPWEVGGNRVISVNKNHIQTKLMFDQAGGTNFAGNFSILAPLGCFMQIGVAHSSHRAWTGGTDKAHLGSVTLVRVPDQCMIIFHGHLFHYGDRAQFSECNFAYTLHMFAYLRDEATMSSLTPVTWPANPKMWFRNDCQ